MTITIAQFDQQVRNPHLVGDTRYVIALPTANAVVNKTNEFAFLQALSASQVNDAQRFTKAAFHGTNILLVANKAHFDAGVTAAGGVEVIV